PSNPSAPTTALAPDKTPETGGSGFQIDPRLTSANNESDTQTNSAATKPEDTNYAPQPSDTIVVSASQTPAINALVHNINTNVGPADKANESEADRQGSTSPDGTKNGAPPQDIPSEKLGFREDK